MPLATCCTSDKSDFGIAGVLPQRLSLWFLFPFSSAYTWRTCAACEASSVHVSPYIMHVHGSEILAEGGGEALT
jgi:hypothetical protein